MSPGCCHIQRLSLLRAVVPGVSQSIHVYLIPSCHMFYFILKNLVLIFIYFPCMCAYMHVEVRGRPMTIRLAPSTVDPRVQAWWQALLLKEPSCPTCIFFYFFTDYIYGVQHVLTHCGDEFIFLVNIITLTLV